MSRWLRVAELSDLPPGKGREVKVLGGAIAVFNTGQRIRAVDGICRHMNAPLAHGRLCRDRLKCRWHGWEYDLADGRCLTKERTPLATYPVKVEGGAVFIDVGLLSVRVPTGRQQSGGLGRAPRADE